MFDPTAYFGYGELGLKFIIIVTECETLEFGRWRESIERGRGRVLTRSVRYTLDFIDVYENTPLGRKGNQGRHPRFYIPNRDPQVAGVVPRSEITSRSEVCRVIPVLEPSNCADLSWIAQSSR